MKKGIEVDIKWFASHHGLTLEQYGAYVRLLIGLFADELPGQITGNLRDLAKTVFHCSEDDAERMLKYLGENKYVTILKQTDGTYKITHSEVQKWTHIRTVRSKAGTKGVAVKHYREHTEKTPSVKKKKAPADPIHQLCVERWFTVYEDLLGTKPTFKGPDAAALKDFIDKVRTKMRENRIDITPEGVLENVEAFIRKAYKVKFVRNNFRLPLINQQFDTIYVYGRAKAPAVTSQDSSDLADAVGSVYDQP